MTTSRWCQAAVRGFLRPRGLQMADLVFKPSIQDNKRRKEKVEAELGVLSKKITDVEGRLWRLKGGKMEAGG